MSGVTQLADGLWRWTARHPEWHPRGAFGAAVGSYALRVGEDTLLVDPLLPARSAPPALETRPSRRAASRAEPEAASGPDPVHTALDAIVAAGRELLILITIPYHVRSTEPLWRRWGGERRVRIFGHAVCARRLPADAPFAAIAAGDALPHRMEAFAIGSPRRQELPLLVPEHRALLLGDAIVEHGGRLRVWIQRELTDQRRRWYRERLAPTLEPLVRDDVERVLVTHGTPVLAGGRAALRAAIDDGPWYHAPH